MTDGTNDGPSKGGRLLDAWIRTHGITIAEAARRLRLSHVQVGHLIRGRRGVSLDSALRIQAVAGVPAESWTEG